MLLTILHVPRTDVHLSRPARHSWWRAAEACLFVKSMGEHYAHNWLAKSLRVQVFWPCLSFLDLDLPSVDGSRPSAFLFFSMTALSRATFAFSAAIC